MPSAIAGRIACFCCADPARFTAVPASTTVDKYGNVRRYQTGEVTLTLTGPAVLVGDNPFAFGAYGGLGAVWIRSLPGRTGTITLTASQPELGQAQVQVRSVPMIRGSQLA